MFKNKRILITGGTGSIGSEIVRQVLEKSPEVIRIYSRDESKHFQLQQEFANHENIRFLVGDVRDKDRLAYATKEVDIIFHAAALKHVPSCEFNPFEAVKTNVLGTQNVIEAAIANKVQRVVSISTDKVVNPVNTMGATKLLSEKILMAAELYKGNSPTKFSCVRFGNVMGSRGSVIPLFKAQIQKGLPITLTHQNMTRFMMTIKDAATLVLQAAEKGIGGETFVLKMPIINIHDLAEILLEEHLSNHRKHIHPGIVEIGIRPGEKLHEELMTLEESERAYESSSMYMILPIGPMRKEIPPDFKKAKRRAYVSSKSAAMSKEDIRSLLSLKGFLD
ncbi:UDP-N-acetylglucosamine 4,6-dehydratase family protein [Falsibacillus albus]|uniref:Polysaccharide biosynthesis protein n=1 Tax=Falsibacillus albus TaxID=2478915 RepID=A0A3L7K4Z0_9BACI|nr:UDP-N-acetylglucosamine 4,6-dehydratase family protein [Falsibacillus albus]RLQ97141.1 polysaccharide biosynthesis protein [Falsibacillus albus]